MLDLRRYFVLHARPYSNTSRLLELFGEDGCRFPAIAKGVRDRRSALAALLQPFRPLLLQIGGRGEVRNVLRTDVEDLPLGLSGERLYCGFYINELLMRLLGRSDPHQGLFSVYESALRQLASGEDMELTLRCFEVALLRSLGYGLVLDREVDGGEEVRPELWYRYQVEAGPARADSGAASGLPELPGHVLLALAGARPWDPSGMRHARTLMRHVLNHYLGGQPLRSRELFQRTFGPTRGAVAGRRSEEMRDERSI